MLINSNLEIKKKSDNVLVDYDYNTNILSLYANTRFEPCEIDNDVIIDYGTGIYLIMKNEIVGHMYQVPTILDTDLTLPCFLFYKNMEGYKSDKELVLSFKLSSSGRNTYDNEGIDSCSIYNKGDKISQIKFQ